MTEKQLRRLRRPALIELLIEQIEENERLEARLSEANDQLRNREITISNAGSIAEAALTLNAVFDDAQKAVDQYIENVKRMNRPEDEGAAEAGPEAAIAGLEASGIIADAEHKASGIVSDAEQRASEIVTGAEQQASGIVTGAERRALDIASDAEKKASDIVAGAERRASDIVSEAEHEAAKILRASLVRAEEIEAGTVEAIGVNMGVVPMPEPKPEPEPEPEPAPEPESEPEPLPEPEPDPEAPDSVPDAAPSASEQRTAMEPRWDEVFAQLRRRNR